MKQSLMTTLLLLGWAPMAFAHGSLSEPIETRQALGRALGTLGVTCKECHDEYRE